MGFSRGFLGPLERTVPAEAPQWLPFRGGPLRTAEVPTWVMGHDMWGGTWEGFPRVSVSLEGKRGPLTEPWAGSMLCWEQGSIIVNITTTCTWAPLPRRRNLVSLPSFP